MNGRALLALAGAGVAKAGVGAAVNWRRSAPSPAAVSTYLVEGYGRTGIAAVRALLAAADGR